MKTFRINLKNEFEAQIYTNILKENDIPYAVIPNHSLVYDGIFEMQRGWGYVEIPEKFKHISLELYNNFKKWEEEKDDKI